MGPATSHHAWNALKSALTAWRPRGLPRAVAWAALGAVAGPILTASAIQAAPAAAATDDRLLHASTLWWWLPTASNSQIDSLVAANDARLIHLAVVRTNPLRFAAAFVANSGEYQREWWWSPGMAQSELASQTATPGVRLLDFERYIDVSISPNPLYAVIALVDEPSAGLGPSRLMGVTNLPNTLQQNAARPVDIEGYDVGGVRTYDLLVEPDTQPSAPPWWVVQSFGRTQLNQFLTDNDARVLDLEVRNPSSVLFDAVVVANAGAVEASSWWAYAVNASQLGAQASQYGARIIDLEMYFNTIQGPSFAAVMVNNSNALTTRLGEFMRYGTDGSTGAYLKEIDGPELAALQPAFIFEPASSMKTVPLLHSLRAVMLGQDALDSTVTFSQNMSGSCPIGGEPYIDLSLRETLRWMMQYSDNAATLAVISRYGAANVNATALNVAGMTHTLIRHQPIGCYPQMLTQNWMTLEDIGSLFSGVATATIVDVPTRDTYFELMLNQQDPYEFWFSEELHAVVLEEAAALGLGSVVPDYWEAVNYAWKPGSYWVGSTWWESAVGWVQLPEWRGAEGYGATDYAFGAFVHGALTPADRAWAGAAELFREAVRARLANYPTVAPPLPVALELARLEPNVPNPFNPRTTLAYTLPEAGPVRLAIYDIRGRLVVELDQSYASAGRHVSQWDGHDGAGNEVASGTYLVRLETATNVATRPIALVR
jgi:hypothetical protein